MISLTEKERESILVLFKGINEFYNANSVSKMLGISHVGAQKIFKRLLKEKIVSDRQIGKSITHKLRLEDDYVCRLVAFLLADEANNFRRWKEEFKEMFKKGTIIMLFGSAVKNYQAASDIDLMVVINKKDLKYVRKIIHDKQELLPKKIHSIELTKEDLISNIKKKQEAIIDIVKNAVILHGHDEYVGVIKNVTSL